jgi:hypothetical protein
MARGEKHTTSVLQGRCHGDAGGDEDRAEVDRTEVDRTTLLHERFVGLLCYMGRSTVL